MFKQWVVFQWIVLGMLVVGLVSCSDFGVLDQPGQASYTLPSSEPASAANLQPPLDDEQVQTALSALEATLSDIYTRVNPSVVNIDISARPSEEHQSIQIGTGSGFVIDAQGYIVTNNHVVRDADEVQVTFSDGMVLEAEVIGGDPYSDLAVIQVSPPDDYTLVPVELGESSSLRVGQLVVAIGSPFGLANTMTVGFVSAIGRALPVVSADQGGFYSNPQIIQTDAAINPGNSGGPLLDSAGRVIGVNDAIQTETGAFSGVGFAIPVSTVKNVVPQLIDTGEVRYSYLGITSAGDVSLAALATEFDVPVTRGALIEDVVPGGPADQAGLRGGSDPVTYRGLNITLGGDIITAIDGLAVNDFNELISYLTANTHPGQVVTLTVVRGGDTIEVEVTLGARPPAG